MPTTRRNTRKRAKEQADDDEDDASHDAQNQPDAAGASATTAPANKKRKLEQSPSLPASSSSLVITDAPDPTAAATTAGPSSSRKRRAKRQESASQPSAARKRNRVKKEESLQPDEELLNGGTASNQETPAEPEIPANDNNVKLEEQEPSDSTVVKMEHDDDESDKENQDSQADPEAPTKRLTAKEKGKARAVDPPEPEPQFQADNTSHSHAHDHAKLQEELAKLRSELQSATATLETQSKALNAVTSAFSCNVCLEALQNPLGLACGHVFCQDDLWNWFHRINEDSDDNDDHDHDDDDDDEGSDGSDDDSISDGFSASDSDSSSVVIQRPLPPLPSAMRATRPENGRSTLEESIARTRNFIDSFRRPQGQFQRAREGREREGRAGSARQTERNNTVIQVDDDYNTSDTDQQEGGSNRPPPSIARPRVFPPGEAPRLIERRRRIPSTDSEELANSDDGPTVPSVRGLASTRPRPRNGAAPQYMVADDGRPILMSRAPQEAGSDIQTRPPSTRALSHRAGPLQDVWNPRSTATIPDDEAGPSGRRFPRLSPAPGATRRRADNTIIRGDRNINAGGARADEPISVPDTDEDSAREAAAGRDEAAITIAAARQPETEPVAGPSNIPAATATEANTQTAAGGADAAPAAATPGPANRRIPARKHPNRRNLTCPQCRVKIVIPPFPIFIIRELANVMRAHDAGRRQASMEREDERDVMSDPTWGGLFPRNASAGTSRLGMPALEDDHDSEAEYYAEPGFEIQDAMHEDMPRLPRFRTGEERRQDNEHDRLVLRMRERQLQRLRASINADRRERAVHGRPMTQAERAVEAHLRAGEDGQIALLSHRLDEARRGAARDGADTHRGRNVLARGMRDADDGVRRCIDCGWEIEHGRCDHCGVTYDSDSEFDDNGEDIGGTSSPPRAGFVEEEESDLSDIVPDSENVLANQSQDYQDIDEDEDEEGSEMESEDGINRPARGTARLHPFSSEEDVDGDEDEDEEGEDLFGDTSVPATDDTVDNPRRRNIDDDGEDTQDETESEAGPTRARSAAQIRRKRAQFLYDSEDDEDDEELAEVEEEEAQAGFIDDDVVGLTGHHNDEEDESEAESTDHETRRARREQKRIAREAAAVTRQRGRGHESESEFTDSESPSTSDAEEENDGENQSLPTSVTSPPSKHEDEDDDGIEEIASQDFLRQNRPRNGLTPAQAAARAAMARQQQSNQAITDVFNRIVNDKQKKAAATRQQRAGSSRQGNPGASTSQGPAVYKKRVIEESDDE